MLDFSGSHILIFLIVALVVVGPKDLPKFLRTIGKGVGKMRRMADQFRNSFDEMARQSELDELRKEIDALRNERISQTAAAELPYQDDEPPIPAPSLPEGATPAEPLETAVEPPSDGEKP